MNKSKRPTDFLKYFDQCFVLDLGYFYKTWTEHFKSLKSDIMFSFRNAYLFNIKEFEIFRFLNSCLVQESFEKCWTNVNQVPVKLYVCFPTKGAIGVQIQSKFNYI